MTTIQLLIDAWLGMLLVILLFVVPILWVISAQFRFRAKMFLYGACFIASATLGALISLPYGRTPKNHFRMFRIFQYSTFWMGTKFELRNTHYTESDKPYILIANHQSALDVLCTTTVSDCWRSNAELRPLNYSHLMVNHSLNFVDSQSLVCTNHIECVWQKFKHGQKSRYGTYRSLLSAYVEEYVWRQKISGPDTFNELWKQTKKHYPCSHCRSGLPCSAMSFVWPENCVVLLKSSLKFVPGFNVCTYLSNSIYINRFNKEKAHKSLDKVTDAIIRENRKVWIFPEGTRNSNGSMLPFKKGAFLIARQAKIPIVPVVFSSYKNFYDMSEFKFNYGGRVVIEALPPIDSSSFEDIDELIAECRKRMEEAYERINEEIRSSGHSNAVSKSTNGIVSTDKNVTQSS